MPDLSQRIGEALKSLLSGSTLYSMTWKEHVTPAGRRLSRLAVSGRRTSANDFTGWPTPRVSGIHGGNHVRAENNRGRLEDAVFLAMWPTPRATDAEKNTRTAEGAAREMARKGSPQDLVQAAQICGPTRLLASGEVLTGSDAEMESGGQLNPAFSAWMMGYPESWCQEAISCQLPRPLRKSRRVG